MNSKVAAAAVAIAMLMMSVPAFAIMPSEDVFADSGSTYAVGLVEGTPYDYSPTFNLSDVTVEISGSAATWLSVSGPSIYGSAPDVPSNMESFDLTIKASTTQPSQEAYQYIQFTVYDTLELDYSDEGTVMTYVGGYVDMSPMVNFTDGVTFHADGLPTGVYIDESSGTISGSPSDDGSYSAMITVNHMASGQEDTYTMEFQVSKAIEVLSVMDMYMVNGQELPAIGSPDYYKLECNIDGVTFELDGSVTGIEINSDGTFSGTPTSMGDIPMRIIITEEATGQTYEFTLNMHIVSKLTFDSAPTGGILVSGA